MKTAFLCLMMLIVLLLTFSSSSASKARARRVPRMDADEGVIGDFGNMLDSAIGI